MEDKEIEKLIAFASNEESRKSDEDVNGGEEKPSGFYINQLISNLVPGAKEEDDEEQHIREEKEKEKDGGLFSHKNSNLISPDSSPRVEEAKEVKAGDFESNKADEGGGGGGGIIGSVVSNLPAPLSDDAAPAPDEASNTDSLHYP